jgi:hypothetical protein
MSDYVTEDREAGDGMTTQKMTLGVDFAGTTLLVREMWSQGKYDGSLAILESMGCPEDAVADVIEGRMKVVNATPGLGELAEDDWTPVIEECPTGDYPKLADLAKVAARVPGLMQDLIDRDLTAVELLLDTDHFRMHGTSDEAIRHLYTALKRYPVKMWRERWQETYGQRLMGRDAETGSYSAYAQSTNVVQQEIDRIIALNNRRAPDPDPEMKSLHGWLLRDGKFYPCSPTEHIWLAAELADLEGDAPIERGWIMVRPNFLNTQRTPTAKQFDALLTWSVQHDKPQLLKEFRTQWAPR